MKVWISAVLATAVAVAVTAAVMVSPASGSRVSAGKQLVIGDILYNNDAYQTAQQKHMAAWAKSLGIKIIFENQLGQGTNAPNLMEDLLSKHVDGIIFQPADATVAVPLVKQAQSKHVPVLGWAIPFGPGVKTPYVGLAESAQTFAAGQRAARYVLKNFPGQPVKVLIVTIEGVSICNTVRMGPFVKGVKSVAPTATVTTINGAGDRNRAVTVTEDELQRTSDYNIATGCNSDMAFGALQAFKAAGLAKTTNKKPAHTYFYSINGTNEELRALTDPNAPLMEVLGLTPKEVARTLINTLVLMIHGKIKPYGTYTKNVPDKVLLANCATANAFNKVEYFAKANLPCVGH